MYNETWVPLRKGGAIRREETVPAHPLANPFPVWRGVWWSCSRLGELLCSPPPFPNSPVCPPGHKTSVGERLDYASTCVSSASICPLWGTASLPHLRWSPWEKQLRKGKRAVWLIRALWTFSSWMPVEAGDGLCPRARHLDHGFKACTHTLQ